jgi:Zn-dependent peptidase ImmA (M78 family)
MRYQEIIAEAKTTEQEFMEIVQDFLPFAMKELRIKVLPKFKLMAQIPADGQPTFGKFVDTENTIYLALDQRHPLDVLRTLAHELVHFRQNTEHQLDDTSGHTGSPEENEAHEVAGIIMRNFNKAHPEYFSDPAIQLRDTP